MISRHHPSRRVAFSAAATVDRLEPRRLLSSQPYTWQNAVINGGGFVDGVFFSPTQQNVIYARTDIGGLYKTTNGGTSWKQLLDFVGSGTTTSGNGTQSQLIGVLSFAIDPENPNNLYADVGEYSGTNGAVFYSTNGGATWGQTNLSFYVGGNSNGRATGERIAVDPYDSNIVLLGSNANGLWESTNAGHSFSQVASFNTSASITFVEFNPYGGTTGSPTQNIIVGLNSNAGVTPQATGNAPTNLYLSTNGGSSWSQVTGTTTGLGKDVLPTTVTTLSRSGTTATVKTASATGFAAGDRVTIAGASPAAYDGTFTITAVSNSTTFTYTIATGTDTATGTITASANYSLIPNHAAWASDGNIYLTYSDGLAPGGTQNVGGVFRFSTTAGTWTNISPQTPGAGTNAAFGYLGLALDPESSTTVAVTSINRYSANDAIWRTTNSTSATPAWVALYDTASAQNYGYGGYDTTRNTSNAAWIAPFGDGIGNWPATIAIDPFNSGHLLYGNGQGLWATNNAASTTQLSAANSWYFPDYGIEFTAVNDLIAPPSGVPLISAMGDINGFVHTTLTASPAAGAISNGYGPLDFDQANPNFIVDLGGGTNGGIYSTNDGSTWTAFAAEAGSGGGTIAVSPTISPGQPTLVWSPSGGLPYYSTNNGATWTASTMPTGTLTGGSIISDRVNDGTFYYSAENSSDNQFSIYKSTNGGATFTLVSQIGTGNTKLVANPFVAGDLWLTDYNGLAHSSNFGATFTYGLGSAQAGYQLALGAPAPGRTNAAVYLWGEIGGIVGLFRSDDSGATFVRVNDVAHQWGGLISTLAADPNVFGRVYLGINGRGIIIGNPAGTLPTGWSDQDINTPGDPGYATSSTNLSNGTTVNQWIVNGGGAGITGGSDQFNFASESISGDASIVAELNSLNNAGTGTPQAGLMFRAGSSSATDPFAAILETTANQLVFEYRTTIGGSSSATTVSGITIGGEYLNLIRQGTNYSAYYGTDGIHWTQLGSTVAITAIPSTAAAGLAVTSNYNPQISSAIFSNVEIVPTVITDVTGNHNYAININPSVPGQLQIFIDVPESSTPTYQIALSQLPSLTFNMGSGNDTLTVDENDGIPVPFGGVTITSGAGSDSLAVIGATATTTANITVNDNTLVNFNAGTGSTLNFVPIAALTIAPSATAVVNASTSHANRTVLTTSALNFTQSNGNWQGKLNLNANDMIVRGGNLTNLTSQINQGYDAAAGANWQGSGGITSATAAADTTHLTSLGVIQNSVDGTPTATALYSTFDGVPTSNTDVLLKYTYIGDATLDGKVDASDYSRIDSAFLSPKTGWFNGDFNFDGVLNGSDYTLIDNAFNTQGARFAASPAISTPFARYPVQAPPAQAVLSTTQLSGSNYSWPATFAPQPPTNFNFFDQLDPVLGTGTDSDQREAAVLSVKRKHQFSSAAFLAKRFARTAANRRATLGGAGRTIAGPPKFLPAPPKPSPSHSFSPHFLPGD